MRIYIKKILTHSAVYGTSNFLVNLTGLFLVPLYTHYLNLKEYGIYSLVMVFSTVIFYIYDLGMINAVVRYYFEPDMEESGKKKLLLSTLLWYFVVSCAILSLCLLWATPALSKLVIGPEGESYNYIMQLAIITVFLNTVSGASITLLRMEERSVSYMCLSGIKSAGIIAISCIFLIFLRRGLNGVYEGIFLATLVFTVMSFFFTWGSYGFGFSFEYLGRLLGYGLPLWPTLFFGWVIDFSNRYFINYFVSLKEVGLYSLGAKLGQVLYSVILAFLLCWGPILFSLAKEKDSRQTLARLATYVAAAFMFICITVSLFSKEIISIMTQESYHSAYKVVPLVSLSYYFFGVYMLFLSGILVSKRVLKQPLVLGVGAVINILLNGIIIPRFGIIGAAAVNAATYLAVALFTYLLAQKVYPVPYELNKLIKATLGAVAVMVIGTFIAPGNIGITIIYKLFLSVIFLCFLFFLGIFNKGQVEEGKRLFSKVLFGTG